MENEKNHIVPYQTFLLVLAGLIALTLISVAVTKIYLGTLTVFIALFIAAVKSTFVLRVFMHLKFENRMFTINGNSCYAADWRGNFYNPSGLPI